MAEKERRFTVINNDDWTDYTDERSKKERLKSYQTNPLNIQGDSLKEQFMRFKNGEGGRRFTVEDLLRS